VPVFVVINKIDICTEKVLNDTLNQIQYLLKSPGCNKVPFLMANDDDAIFAAQNLVEAK
jgi:GTPase